MPAGRPSDYRDEFCDCVLEWGKQGKSRAWMAAEMGICRQTLANWEEAHPEFLDATTRAGLLSQQWWEDAGQDGMISDKFNASVWSKSMAARFPADWRDKTLLGSDPDNPLPPGFQVNLVKPSNEADRSS